jgi:ZIP family zinc transporter
MPIGVRCLNDFLIVLAISAAAAIASPIGGLLALWRQPNPFFMSVAIGFAGGVLLATISFEMLPNAVELGSVPIAVGGFLAGFGPIYAFDLFIHRGKLAGPESEHRPQVDGFHRRRRPRGGMVTVLAGGTSAEELVEGLSIGIGSAIKPGVGLLIALAIVIDNLAEALSIGELIRSEEGGRRSVRRVLGWTGLIGVALLSSALAGWFLLRGLSQAMLGFLFAVGAGGMFYLTIADLVPAAEQRHYQQSAALATGAGFVVIFVLARFI